MRLLKGQRMTMSKGLVFDIKRFAVHDGQGIRSTIFLKGCPLRCQWCQNPEGLNKQRQVLYLENRCIHCLSCVHASLKQGVTCTDGKIIVHRDIDEDWDRVIDVCPTSALRWDSQWMTSEELVDTVLKDSPFFRHGGGVTISGGEPFLQVDFLKDILQRLKTKGIHTAIETSLYTSLENVQSVLPYLDQIYCDLKVWDPSLHKQVTGVSNEIIKENIRFLLTGEKKDVVTVRTPMIPGMNDTKENVRQIAKFLSDTYTDVQYELLNYNPLAPSKYAYLDMEYGLDKDLKRQDMEVFYSEAMRNGIRHLIIE